MRIRFGIVEVAFLLTVTLAPSAKPVPPPDDVAAPPRDAEKTGSGLASKVLRPGKGTAHPAKTDVVTVHYTGWTTDGRPFDSSIPRQTPNVFPLKGVVKGLAEGLQLMVPGEKTRFWVPAALANGDRPRPGAPAGMLVFDVELISFAEPEGEED
ncbi:MAG: peptidylprolyl isomerase [Verrucomicrobiota bacterium]